MIASSICPSAIDVLRKDHDVICAFNEAEDELKAKIPDRDILIFRSGVDFNAQVLASAANLSLLIRAGSGIDDHAREDEGHISLLASLDSALLTPHMGANRKYRDRVG